MGPKAFPEVNTDWNRHTEQYEVSSSGGMELRDYFAAKAMQGAFTSPIDSTEHGKNYIAMHAYKMADAMLKARTA